MPPYKVYNIGNNRPENLLDFVRILQEELVRAGVLPAGYDFDAHKELVPMQPGDVPVTYAAPPSNKTSASSPPRRCAMACGGSRSGMKNINRRHECIIIR